MKKIIMVVVVVALFAGAVGVGVHVMHRDALAVQTYKIQCITRDLGDPCDGVAVRFTLDPGGANEEILNFVTDASGVVTVQRAFNVGWEALIVNGNGWILAPNDQTNPANLSCPQVHTFTFIWGQG